MGTTLRVHGLKLLVKNFAKSIHAQAGNANRRVVYVNRTPPAKEWAGIIDYHVLGDTDAWVHMVQQDWVRSKPSEWVVQTLLDGSDATRPLRVVKDTRQERLKPGILPLFPRRSLLMNYRHLQRFGQGKHRPHVFTKDATEMGRTEPFQASAGRGAFLQPTRRWCAETREAYNSGGRREGEHSCGVDRQLEERGSKRLCHDKSN